MEPNTQLELFEIPRQAPDRRHVLIPENLHLRPDHAVLLVIVGLLGVSVVFAAGVERGKRLARAERLLSPQASIPRATASIATKSGEAKAGALSSSSKNVVEDAAEQPGAPARNAAPSQEPVEPPGMRDTVARGRPRFAIQVMSYSQPKLAQQELQRLQQRGEQAFVVNTQGRMAVLVGPFPTKDRASVRLASLKRRYHDCFVRML